MFLNNTFVCVCVCVRVCVCVYIYMSPPRDRKTLMIVVGLVWSNDSRSYAGGSVATGRASHATLVRDEDPDLEAIQSVLQDCWWLDVRLST